LELEGLAFVIDTEEVLHRGVQIMHMDRIPQDVVAELVGLAVDMTRRAWDETPSGSVRKSTGSVPALNFTPWCSEGRNPEPQRREWSG
jgi:hypothetical protein